MNQEKWQELLIRIENSFTVSDHGKETGQIEGESIEYIEWEMPDKQMRAESHTRPKLIDKKTLYSRRIGSQIKEQRVYSDEEQVFFVNFFERFNDDDEWQEMRAGDFV